MNLHALRIFNDVSKTGSITRSAGNLLLSQPAVTAQIRNLERELGMKLIEANGRNIQLTEAGIALARHSQRLFAMEAEMEEMMEAIKSGQQGSLRICATELPESALLPGWLVGYKQEHPRMDVQLLKGNSRTALQRLQDDSVHISIVCGNWPIEAEDIETYTIMEDELIFAMPALHRLAGKEVTFLELMEEPFVLREEGSYTRKQLWSLIESSDAREPRRSITIEGLKESIEAVKAGYGAALVPALSIKKELASGELGKVKVSGVTFPHPIRVCTKRQEARPAQVHSFISYIQADIREKNQYIHG
ncbi:LysR family transcriptional regulator [Paenibacillus sp. NPDC093718]|uniref:LysR family transcriptional regulator n=1 Tax=Paenibacillus sp. NPDC093718 TaxID=3390601 RepID=UPI003CFF9C2B